MSKINMGYFSLSSDGKYVAVLAHNEVHILTSTVRTLLDFLRYKFQ